MRKLIAVATACVLIGMAAPAAVAQDAQAPPAEKKLTPQQQKLKNCGAEWQAMKKEGKTAGLKWADYRRDCLRKR